MRVESEQRSLLRCHSTRAEIVLHAEMKGGDRSSGVVLSEVAMSSCLSSGHSTHTRPRERLTSGDPLSASYKADRAVVIGLYRRRL